MKKGIKKGERGGERKGTVFATGTHGGCTERGIKKANQVFSFDRKGGREIVTDLRALSFSR